MRCRPGESVTLKELREHLSRAGLAKRYFPERVVVIDEFPRTMSGKIRKVELRGYLCYGRRQLSSPMPNQSALNFD